jgi:hypothetical protein
MRRKKMKNAVIALCVTAAVLSALNPAFSQEKPSFKAVASDVKGKPEVTRKGEKQGAAIKNGTAVYEGDAVLAGFGSSLGLKFDDGSVAWVPPVTMIVLTRAYAEKKASKVHLKLNFGAIRATVPRKDVPTDFRISTPTVTCSVKGTEIKEVRANIDMPDTVMMGRVGRMDVEKNPKITLGGNEGTNSNFITPIDLAQIKSWVAQTQFGNTNTENKGNKNSSIPLITNMFDYLTGPSRSHMRHQAGHHPHKGNDVLVASP